MVCGLDRFSVLCKVEGKGVEIEILLRVKSWLFLFGLVSSCLAMASKPDI